MRAATDDDRYGRGLDAYASQFRIARADLAEFLLGAAVEGSYVRQTPVVASGRKKGARR